MNFTFVILTVSLLLCLNCLTDTRAIGADLNRVHRTIQRKWQAYFGGLTKQISGFGCMVLGYSVLFCANMVYPLFGYKQIWRVHG